ncbi:alpha/beta fold hydrolase [Actinophytocola algeriensis]|uniref:Pimeloyl-ACP methyl ester carboxylesterase n=1 Tax=Actinophytocola algeriensis TaxID=1768010 RepID=A0A7W7Q1Q0_9PSEU|nr:alpha/beta fold hydrolase [Actinophytocola algeriensis]MBB4905402.1 pimeloyl-ACP methyl ester carboxylesterase [Actinophytocola algeriensis]MBE1472913.1 pimeloyl-ACP methyl ester carboxylesterase [Actinophytocola algeriensis]
MSHAAVNGITIGYDDEGTGENVLVLVHGHPFDRSMWRPQVDHARALGWRVLAADLRGYGESTVVPGVTPLSTFAADIAALADHLGVAQFVLGGLSMGGQIVLECVRRFPDRIRGLLLADTFAQAETLAGRAARHDMADRLVREGMAGYAEEVRWKMVARRNPEAAEYVARMMHSAPPEGAAAALRGRAERPDYTPVLETIAVPTLVVVGSDDAFTPVADAEYLHDRIPGSTLVVVDGAAHLPNLERPADFDAALEALLGRVR